ncbi:hypothetical protein [Chitinophaga sp. Cy-1792]|uniref:hypothetical protein n=1 Tax=Chitinophaga sp. Cy-1792 TaxID=2608339 RepID=UPI00141F012D|nr:hypothetical protein [Chitinophaga sp. Cy-1792]NIG55227.1 hypothetical protein [Chitinophaga sp. Cy-1792]
MYKRCLVFVVSITVWMGCYAQDSFRYRQLPAAYSIVSAGASNASQAMGAAAGSAFDATSVLPAGYVKDGSVDYTQQLQSAIDGHNVVKMPNFPVMINDRGIQLKSNSSLIFQSNSKLVLQGTDKGKYAMLKLLNVQHVNIYSPVLVGDKDNHKGTSGEWGMGIDIRGSSDVNIYHPQVSKCWGDGLYIGQAGKDNTNNNINIYYASMDDNRRNGITIGSVKGLKLIKPVVSNTSGTLPMCGIDIEPNSSNDMIDDIDIDQPVTYNNGKYGLVIGLARLPGPLQKQVNITINKHTDDGSPTGFWMGGTEATYTPADKPLAGNIQVIDPVWKNNSMPFKGGRTYDMAPPSKFRNVSIMKQGGINEVDKIKRAQANKKNLEID